MKNNSEKISSPASAASSVPSSPEPPVSAKFYPNLDTYKEKILFDNKNKAGIYMFKNNINEKKYVGSSENLRIRFLQYFNINYLIRDNSMQICRALKKYGYSNFSLTIIEYCEPEKCIERERFYIDFF
jgi:hypothetical protein